MAGKPPHLHATAFLEAPRNYRPQWYVQNLVYLGGNPQLPTQDMAGGGVVPTMQTGIPLFLSRQYQKAAITDGFATGLLPTRENQLTALLKGKAGPFQ